MGHLSGQGQTPGDRIQEMAEVRPFTAAEYEYLKLVRVDDEGSKHLKVFRNLRTQLMKKSEGKTFTCLVVSVVSGGGSYVASNLASIIALDQSKTSLLVDANLYSPSAERLLPVPSQFGLSDYLADPRIRVEDIIYATGAKRLRVLPSGTNREGGTEKIHSNRMFELFKEIRDRYSDRFIVVDSPSAIEYDAEVRILTELCDCVVLVVPYGKVTPGELLSTIEKIDKKKLVGVVYDE